MINFKNVSKVYEHEGEELVAVNQVNLQVERGEIFGVIGFSGAGKSTLVRLVNQLEKPTEGEVLVDGQDVSSLSAKELRGMRRKISMIFQHFNLLESKTVYHNVAFPLILSGEPKDKIEKRVEEILDFVGLKDRANYYTDQLSGGQKQRVGIARALATSPDILLCDEATSALDPETTQSILELLRRIRDEYNVTILMITHEMNVVKDVCDRVAVMEDGEVIEQGSIFDLFTNPKHQTTHKFIQSVMKGDIPQSILKGIEENNHPRHIYRVTFLKEHAGEPVFSRIAKRFNVEVNILYGQILEIQETPFGNLIVELQGEDSEIVKAVHYIEETVSVERVMASAS
ncbi:methionine ABC transporter ATP-binding protein [Alkalibacillus haloalkaliphilus]|uniref:methionine ABC transporter ATP-binding protein n=1 Tax=Alkalibacillus haloalkaliphilus TaxID=94136 RepID=UPI002935CB96|nr:methionine ABC transporter ATP-binding protein [Alkalibacillus haloalkaliphilus]MDV2581490.1 methionine ABC transporter ATP-binding protein [Alkalibacillus haloalkaliphilus]